MRWAVDLHGGRIEVADSRRGATMRVTLPAHAGSAPFPPEDGDASYAAHPDVR